jgi:hypothetical protein
MPVYLHAKMHMPKSSGLVTAIKLKAKYRFLGVAIRKYDLSNPSCSSQVETRGERDTQPTPHAVISCTSCNECIINTQPS